MTERQFRISGTVCTDSPGTRRCIIEATIEPLRPFRRGYARSKAGPFFDLRTVHALIKSGGLRLLTARNVPGFGHVTARAA